MNDYERGKKDGIALENARLRKQRDDLVRSNQELEKMNLELRQELEAQLREKMGDELVDSSLFILDPQRHIAPEGAVSEFSMGCRVVEPRCCICDEPLSTTKCDHLSTPAIGPKGPALVVENDAHREAEKFRTIPFTVPTATEDLEAFHGVVGESRKVPPEMAAVLDASVEEHCDDFINDLGQPEALRWFLFVHRLPAMDKYLVFKRVGKPRLFAKLGQCWVQVVMASRLGDVGISYDLKADCAYETRLMVSKLTDFTDEVPDEPE